MPGGQFLELLLLKWSDFDNSKIAAGHFTHNYGLDPVMATIRESLIVKIPINISAAVSER